MHDPLDDDEVLKVAFQTGAESGEKLIGLALTTFPEALAVQYLCGILITVAGGISSRTSSAQTRQLLEQTADAAEKFERKQAERGN